MFGLESLRQRVLLPQQFWGQRLVDSLLLALRPAASPAALDDLGALDLIIPRPREDVVSLACAVGHHSRHLLKRKSIVRRPQAPSWLPLEAKIVSLCVNEWTREANIWAKLLTNYSAALFFRPLVPLWRKHPECSDTSVQPICKNAKMWNLVILNNLCLFISEERSGGSSKYCFLGYLFSDFDYLFVCLF